MGLFKKKIKVEQLRKIVLTTNEKGLGEYRCPYCNAILVVDHVRNIQPPEINFCPNCSKEFIK